MHLHLHSILPVYQVDVAAFSVLIKEHTKFNEAISYVLRLTKVQARA